MNLLNVRAIVNGKEIFPLPVNKKIIIQVQENNPKIVVTDGYHFAKPLELVYHHLHVYYFKVVCAIDNMQLISGCTLLVVLYLSGFYFGFLILKLASFAPFLYFLFIYYINRKDFIQITPV